MDEATTKETVWKAQGKTRSGIEDSIAIGTAQIAKALEPKLVLKTTDHFYKALAIHYSPVKHISKSDPKNHDIICNSLDTARRFVFSVWPRAIPPSLLAHKPPYEWEMLSEEDKKRIIQPDPDCGVTGKMAGNGLVIWGETMFDVYKTYRIPGFECLETTMAGSKVARWIRENGTSDDVELSKDRLEWAEEIEGEPKVLLPVDVRATVRKWEKEVGWRGGRQQEIFPFGELRPAKLQHRIPLHRLPKKLIVHDPFELLSASTYAVDWYKKKDPSTLDWPSPLGSPTNPPPATTATSEADEENDGVSDTTTNTSNVGSNEDARSNSDMNVDDAEGDEQPAATPDPPRTDIVHTYTLELSSAGEKRVAEELERLSSVKRKIRELIRAVQKNPHTSTVRALLKKFRCGILDPPFCSDEVYERLGEQVRRVLKTGTKEKTDKWVFVMYGLPEWLRSEEGDENAEEGEALDGKPNVNDDDRLDTDSEAHVYISAKHNLGVGNHSIVWDVDCDLPRETIFDGSIFPLPTWEEGFGGRKRRYPDLEIVEDNGALDDIMIGDEDFQGVVDGKEEYRVCKECVVEKAMEIWGKGKASTEGGQTKEEEFGYLERISDPGLPPLWESCDPLRDPASNDKVETETTYLLDAGRPARNRVQYEGPVQLIDTGVEWQDLRFPTCRHFEATKLERFGALVDRQVRAVSRRGSCVREVWGMESVGDGEGNKAMDVDVDVDVDDTKPSSNGNGNADKARKGRVPTHARVRLTAKLSIQHDEHLECEAENYEKFPDHFFERWSGFNVCRPIHEPVPVGAIVPQYYGYYVPTEEKGRRVGGERKEAVKSKDAGQEDDGVESEDGEERVVTNGEDRDASEGERRRKDDNEVHLSYRSPIMLLEHCGEEIRPSEMSIDDRREAASLFHRMHEEWWVHSSPYARNILVQDDACEGGSYASDLDLSLSPQTNAPYKRFLDGNFVEFLPTDSQAEIGLFQSWVREKTMMRPKKSFRMIDFGRSEVEAVKNRPMGRRKCDIMGEESDVRMLFRLGFYNV